MTLGLTGALGKSPRSDVGIVQGLANPPGAGARPGRVRAPAWGAFHSGREHRDWIIATLPSAS